MWWKTYPLICSFLKSEKFVHDASRTRWRLIWNFQKSLFDPPKPNFVWLHVLLEILNMYWSVLLIAWPFDWFPRVWPWPCHLWLPPAFNETQSFMYVAPAFECCINSNPGSSTNSNAIHIYLVSLHYIHTCLHHIFYFFLSLPKFISGWLMIQIIWEFLHYLPYCV